MPRQRGRSHFLLLCSFIWRLFSEQPVSLLADMKHVSELAALIPSVLLPGGLRSNKFSQFAFKDASCQLQPCCRPLVFGSEKRFPLRFGSSSETGFPLLLVSPEMEADGT